MVNADEASSDRHACHAVTDPWLPSQAMKLLSGARGLLEPNHRKPRRGQLEMAMLTAERSMTFEWQVPVTSI